MHLKQIWDLIRESLGRRWTITPRAWAQLDDYAPSLGAALVYYTLFSIAPVLTAQDIFATVVSTITLVVGATTR